MGQQRVFPLRQARQRPREQAALECLGDPILDLQPRPLDLERHPVAHELQQLDILIVELARGERTDVQNADQRTLDDQGHAEQRADALLAQQGVHHLHR